MHRFRGTFLGIESVLRQVLAVRVLHLCELVCTPRVQHCEALIDVEWNISLSVIIHNDRRRCRNVDKAMTAFCHQLASLCAQRII